jgi:hypothetical protein
MPGLVVKLEKIVTAPPVALVTKGVPPVAYVTVIRSA